MKGRNLMEEHAREVAGMPPEWCLYRYQAIGSDGRKPAKLLRLTGAVTPPKTRGKNKGQPNWRKMDKKTKREVYLTPAEHDEWCLAWEKSTGMCHECTGTKQVVKSWDITTGFEYKSCPRCGGAEKRKAEE